MSDQNTAPSAKPQVLRVHRYDPQTSTSKQKQIIQLGAGKSLKDQTLKEVREILVENAVFDSKDLKSPFCEKDGSDVGDDMNVELYLTLLGIESVEASKIDFYFKKKKLFNKVDQATQDFIKQKLDLAFQNPPEVLKKNPQLLTSSFDPSDWKAVQGDLSHAADLNEREWSVIIRSNCLLNGYQVVMDLDKKPQKIERCAYNAFKLRPRKFEGYEISKADDSDDDSSENQKEYKFRIPRFRVDDDSSVSVVETKSAFEKSCADSSFVETSFQVAGSVNYNGISAGVEVGGGGGSSDNNNEAEKESEEKLTVNYNYPRVTMYWDPDCLEVSTECVDAIRTVRDPETLREFNAKFGVLFARRVQLGGRLSYSEARTAKSKLTAKDHGNKMKAAASISISHSFAQASVKASHENQDREVKEEQNQKLSTNIAWEATGGDTLLCNNPAEWCATVGLYSNWRIVNQDNAEPLYEFLSHFPKVGKKIIKRFKLSADRELTREEEEDFNSPEDKEENENEDEESDDDDSGKKERHQVFQLFEPKSRCYMGVSDGTDDIVKYLNRWMLRPQSSEPINNVKQNGASIQCIFPASDQRTEFIADTVFEEGEQEQLKYKVPLKFRSWGHPNKQWVRMILPFIRGPGILATLINVSSSGAPFTIRDAENPNNTGDIPDGASVYITFGRSGIGLDSIVTQITEEGFVKMARWVRQGNEGYVKPLPFIYKAKDIVEIDEI